MSNSLWPQGLHNPWNSPDQNTGVGSRSLLQGIFPTQGSNPGLLHCRQIVYHLSHKGSPRTLEWVSYPFSSGSSWPRNWTQVSCIAGGFFTGWASREKHCCIQRCLQMIIHSFTNQLCEATCRELWPPWGWSQCRHRLILAQDLRKILLQGFSGWIKMETKTLEKPC